MSTKIPIWLLKFRHFCHLVTQIDYPKFTKLCKKIYPKFFGIDILGKIIMYLLYALQVLPQPQPQFCNNKIKMINQQQSIPPFIPQPPLQSNNSNRIKQ